MFLPVRGGDLLRVQYSQKIAEIGYASLLSRLLIEKFLDFLVIVAIGILALMHIHGPSAFLGYSKSLIEITFVLVTLIIVTLVIKYLNVILLSWFRSVFRLAGKEDFFQRHIAQLAHDARGCLNVRNMIPPFVVTLFMWLSAYALSYILAASFVGVELSYSEALLIMAAGALGLMLPAAPSGIGTFHASIVSAFLFIGRSSTEGLLVATSIHLLFFVAFALPAALICGSWRVGKTVPG